MTATLERSATRPGPTSPSAGAGTSSPLWHDPATAPAGRAQATAPTTAAHATARPAQLAGVGVLLLGLLIFGFGAYLVVLAPIQQGRAQDTLAAVITGQLRSATAPVDGIIPVGSPVAVLEIPRLGLTQVIAEGSTSRQLMAGPGHRRDTPLPGQAGVSVIMGRSGLFGGPFGRIGELRLGNELTITTGQGRSTYVVTGRRDSTQSVPPPGAAPSSVVLSTAAPPLAPDRTLIITAELTSPVLPGRTTPTAISAAERSLTGDSSAALPLMLWSQALILVVCMITYGYLRWERWPTYVISTPILLAVLWNVYENAAQLLPNTM